jgi:Tfp pilus assembly protein PilN
MTVQTLSLTEGRLPRVNLLPPEIAENRRFRRLQGLMGLALVGALVLVGAGYEWAHHGVTAARAQLAVAQQQTSALDAKLARFAYVKQTQAQVAADHILLTQAMGQQVLWSHYLTDLSLLIPDTVWLTQVQASETSAGGSTTSTAPQSSVFAPGIGTLTFTGVAFSHDDVANWLVALAKQRGFANVYFSNSTETKAGSKTLVDFTSSVSLTSDALSNRYVMGGLR